MSAETWLDHAYEERCRELEALRDLHESVVGTAHQLRDERDALLACCKELREAVAGALRVMVTQEGLAERFTAEMARIGIRDGIGVRVEAAIAKAEGR